MGNTPHVVFFAPIIDRLRADGHEVVITLRDFAQTLSVAEKFGIKGAVIGGHGGGSKLGKILNLCQRTTELMGFAMGQGFDLAISHNSYHQIVAARILGCRVVTLMDYEGQPANHLAFRVASQVIVPAYFPAEALNKFGASPKKVDTYRGYKEQVYLNGYSLSEGFAEELAEAFELSDANVLNEKVVVTVRTPPALAAYHQFDNDIFPAILDKLNKAAKADEAVVLVLPRTEDQRKQVQSEYPNLHVPAKAVDGRDLCAFSDLVISAGGTMNREAALLGTPVWSTFAGAQPAVDKALQDKGLMKQLSHLEQLDTLELVKKSQHNMATGNDVLEQVVSLIIDNAS